MLSLQNAVVLRFSVAATLAIAAALLPTTSLAQSGSRGGGGGGAQGFGLGSGGGQLGSSTAEEGALNGRASLTEATGRSSLKHAEAAVLGEDIRRSRIEARLIAIEQNTLRQAARSSRREASLAAKRDRLMTRRMLRESKTQALAKQLRLQWPSALNGEPYATLRAEIEGLLILRRSLGAKDGAAVGAALGSAVRQVIRQASEDVYRERITREEYDSAKRFARALPEWRGGETSDRGARRLLVADRSLSGR